MQENVKRNVFLYSIDFWCKIGQFPIRDPILVTVLISVCRLKKNHISNDEFIDYKNTYLNISRVSHNGLS